MPEGLSVPSGGMSLQRAWAGQRVRPPVADRQTRRRPELRTQWPGITSSLRPSFPLLHLPDLSVLAERRAPELAGPASAPHALHVGSPGLPTLSRFPSQLRASPRFFPLSHPPTYHTTPHHTTPHDINPPPQKVNRNGNHVSRRPPVVPRPQPRCCPTPCRGVRGSRPGTQA